MSYSKNVLLSLTAFSRQEISEIAKDIAMTRLEANCPYAAETGEPLVRWQDDGTVEVVIPFTPAKPAL